ncbi:bifunctional Translational (tr)-type GTP-binding domain/Translation initiation factor IF- 2/P-loop containing nucleoside triphosphate hydrolase/Translation protein [Babesia duncani]|uniref:Bifunctional Translational (Tr)-type GTP-binding domain/Translation initiation factor IF- 2/P-loop containing nucleoside triphosphate hydrolase/Translation protein n=1 Tax=Babesia duncani TaxID=323732 RepID=A0AAD9UM38_9APIC|nr:bifunctional Translational (tr)-type GTP-binding domain/Translation initiation factor IF- 2/P-loop containing nucleoside triphosphate hydrolase/Translation protein [Babesia duncani]
MKFACFYKRISMDTGANKNLLDIAKRLLDVANNRIEIKSDFELQFQQVYQEIEGQTYIGPSFLYLLLSHLISTKGKDVLKDKTALKDLGRCRILHFDILEPPQHKNLLPDVENVKNDLNVPKPIVFDETLENDVLNLLSSIKASNKLKANVVTDSNIPKFDVEKDHNTRNPDQLDFQIPENYTIEAVKPTACNHKVTKTGKLSCEAIASFVKCNLGDMEEIATILECDPNNLTIEEAELILDELGLANTVLFTEQKNGFTMELSNRNLVARPLVVTIMGHVDHGKTSLLDQLQKTDLVSGEAGRITQRIGAFEVETSKGKVVFLDTPGHAAFTTMRSRGAKCTDLIILLVAADDGIMPQTIEAIEIIKNGQIPFIVVVNKIDIADGHQIAEDLQLHGLHLNRPPVYISAKKGINVDSVFNAIFDMESQISSKADLNARGSGYVFETSQHPKLGRMLNVLVRNGTFNESSWINCDGVSSKVKRFYDENGKCIKNAIPSQIVQIPWPHDIRTSAGAFVQQAKSQMHANKLAKVVIQLQIF